MRSRPKDHRGFVLLMVTFVGIVAAAGACPSRAASPGPRKVTVKAGFAGDAKTAETYLSANATYVRETLPGIVRDCAVTAPEDAVVSFDLTLTIGHGGKVVAATSDPSNAFSSCVSAAAKKAVFREPPRIPSDVYLEVSIAR